MSLIVLGSKYEWDHVQQCKTDKKWLACLYGTERQHKKNLGINPTPHSLINLSWENIQLWEWGDSKMNPLKHHHSFFISWTIPPPISYFSVCYSSSSSSCPSWCFYFCCISFELLVVHGTGPSGGAWKPLLGVLFLMIPESLSCNTNIFPSFLSWRWNCLSFPNWYLVCQFSHSHSWFTWVRTLWCSRTQLCWVIHCLWLFLFFYSFFFNGSQGQEFSPSLPLWPVVSLSFPWQGL